MPAVPAAQMVPDPPQWRPATVLAFRFGFAYLALETFQNNPLFQLLGAAFGWIPGRLIYYIEFYVSWPISWLLNASQAWTARHVLHLGTEPLAPLGGGSGDSLFAWTRLLAVLLLAFVATAVWSLTDRKRRQYTQLHRWFTIYLRFALAGYLFTYGAMKIVPNNQFPFPNLSEMLTPVGQMTPMHLFWVAMGESARYKFFTGSVEMLGGFLLVVPRTALLGALVSLGAMANVFVINTSYDVPVKILSFHLVAIAAVLAAPSTTQLWDFFVRHRGVAVAPPPAMFRRPWLQRGLLGLQIVFGLYLAGSALHEDSILGAAVYRPASAPLQGLWRGDGAAWRQAIFVPFNYSRANYKLYVTFADGSRQTYLAAVGNHQDSLALWRVDVAGTPKRPGKPQLQLSQQGADEISFDGAVDGVPVHAKLRRELPPAFTLTSPEFQRLNWVTQYPHVDWAEH